MDIDEAAFQAEQRYVPMPGKPTMYSISPAPPHSVTMHHYMEEEEARMREERDDVVSESVWGVMCEDVRM